VPRCPVKSLDPKLLAAVLAHPLDDAPRLALAAELRRQGDPRGDFIALQCLLATRSIAPDRRADLKRDCERQLREHGAAWMAGAAGLRRREMRRGFIDEIECAASALPSLAAELFAAEPITRLTLTKASAGAIAKLARTDTFARVLRLTLRGSIGDDGASALAGALSRRTTPLISLNAGSTGIESAGVAALASALRGCRTLTLTGNSIGDDGLAALASSRALTALETLFLAATEITDEGLTALAKSPSLQSLTRLGVARNDEVTRAGLRALVTSKKLGRLRWLEYSDDGGAQIIAVRA
jgi:uncharacterized protein (TIGR02996 family)